MIEGDTCGDALMPSSFFFLGGGGGAKTIMEESVVEFE